ncbi:hypothetical protein PQX77_002814 [Marasmius sp. AFHP31]|nr:hypothetical protein PQX77_002814 [Marasmius sp. AFHP31]
MILNPAIKLSWLAEQEANERGVGLVEKAKELFIREIVKKQPAASAPERPTATAKADKKSWIAHALRDKKRIAHASTPANHARAKALSYLSDMTDLDDFPNTLTFWQVKGARWSRIFALAMDILPVQGSSVPCKPLFSSAKLTKTNLRNRMSPHIMEQCLILKHGYKTEGPLDFTRHFNQDNMEAELIGLTEKDDESPLEDVVELA